jgi:SpoVK/Ycf46/Vps4 family AAA+-type ATPase
MMNEPIPAESDADHIHDWAISKIGNPYDQYIVYDVETNETICNTVNFRGNALRVAASPAALKACKRFVDQINNKPAWDDAGWIECFRLAKEALEQAGIESNYGVYARRADDYDPKP